MRVACALVATWLSIAVGMAGCGGSNKQPVPAPGPVAPTEPASDPTGADPVATVEPGGPAANPLLSEDQCNQMVDHMIDVQLSAKRAEGGDEAMPKPEAVEQIRGEIKADFVPQCRARFRQDVFECWQAATTPEAFEACAGGRGDQPEDAPANDGA